MHGSAQWTKAALLGDAPSPPKIHAPPRNLEDACSRLRFQLVSVSQAGEASPPCSRFVAGHLPRAKQFKLAGITLTSPPRSVAATQRKPRAVFTAWMKLSFLAPAACPSTPL